VNNSKKGILISLIIVVVLAFLYISSQGSREGVKESGLVEESSQATIEEVEGLPENFPQDFPIYPDAAIEDSFITKGEEVEAQSVVWVTEGTVEEVGKYYDDQLAAGGWNVEYTSGDESSIVFSFSKGEVAGFAGIGITEEGLVVSSVTVGTSFEPSM
jgi:hypothetical protein